MVRVVGESTVPAGGIGTQPRLGTVSHCIDLDFRSGLLLCNLPSRHIPGCCFMAGGKRKKNRFRYSPALSWLRYGAMVIFILAMISGLGAWAALIAPYSAYGRIASNLFAPLWQWETTFWPTWQNGRTIMPSTKRKSGYGASQPLSLPQLPSLY